MEEAFQLALFNIKRQKRMKKMKYPFIEKKRYRIKLYFTNAEGSTYFQVVKNILERKQGTKIKAVGLYCFEFDYKQDAWFINDKMELVEYIQILFDKYFSKNVKIN